MVDVGVLISKIQAKYPEGQRGPKQMRELWNLTWDAWKRLNDEFPLSERMEYFVKYPTYLQWEQDATRLTVRMHQYDEAISRATREDELNSVINGLLLNFPGSGHTTPDAVTPFTLGNQLEVLREFNEENSEQFWDDLEAGVDTVVVKPASGLANVLWAAAGLVGVVLIYKYVRK